jgi:hypothetical protein
MARSASRKLLFGGNAGQGLSRRMANLGRLFLRHGSQFLVKSDRKRGPDSGPPGGPDSGPPGGPTLRFAYKLLIRSPHLGPPGGPDFGPGF